MTLTEHRRVDTPVRGPQGAAVVQPGDEGAARSGAPGGGPTGGDGVGGVGGVGGAALAQAGWVAVIATLVGLAFRPVFAPEPLLVPALVAACASVALSTVVTRVAHWPASAALVWPSAPPLNIRPTTTSTSTAAATSHHHLPLRARKRTSACG